MKLDNVYPEGNPLPAEDRTQAQTDGVPESAGPRNAGRILPLIPREMMGNGDVFFLYGPSRLHCRACPEETRAEAMA